MKDFLPMLDDKASLYVSFHRVLDVPGLQNRTHSNFTLKTTGQKNHIEPFLTTIIYKSDMSLYVEEVEVWSNEGVFFHCLTQPLTSAG